MLLRNLFGVLLVFSIVGCGSKITANSEIKDSSSKWQKILSCDNERVWVDVDVNERRNLQLVIRNREAIRYFDSIMAKAGSIYWAGGSEQGFAGGQERGIFGSDELIGANYVSHYYSYDGTAMPLERGYSAYATSYDETITFKQENGGLKVEFVRSNINQCHHYYGRYGKCDEQGTFFIESQYRGNWFFGNCRRLD